jgi:hypothetical protein
MANRQMPISKWEIKNGRADPLPFNSRMKLLAAIDGLLQLGAGGELGDPAGGNFDGGPGLRIAAVARLPL